METKLFELRDRMTFIPLLCIKPEADDGAEPSAVQAMVRMAGYWDSGSVVVTHMGSPQRGCHSDPFDWGDRTFQTAHLHIRDNWDALRSGDLSDVCVILGEATEPCESEVR